MSFLDFQYERQIVLWQTDAHDERFSVGQKMIYVAGSLEPSLLDTGATNTERWTLIIFKIRKEQIGILLSVSCLSSLEVESCYWVPLSRLKVAQQEGEEWARVWLLRGAQ